MFVVTDIRLCVYFLIFIFNEYELNFFQAKTRVGKTMVDVPIFVCHLQDSPGVFVFVLITTAITITF